MKADEFYHRALDGEPMWPLFKKFTRTELWFAPSETPWLIRSYETIKVVLWSVIKFLILSWIFLNKVYPSQGWEKTTIFIMLLILVTMQASRRRGTT